MDDDLIEVGKPLPRIASVEIVAGRRIRVTWRSGETKTVDLAPALENKRLYKPLRAGDQLFQTMRVNEDGNAVAWDNGVELSAITIERLPALGMDNAAFRAAMDSLGYTLDGMAAELGVSRRQIAAYRGSKPIPNSIVYAVRYLLGKAGTDPGARGADASARPARKAFGIEAS